MKRFLLSLLLVVGCVTAQAQITPPNVLVAGTVIRAADLNTNFSTLGNHALDRITGGNIQGNVTLDSGITLDGIDIGATICPTCDPTFRDGTLRNLTLTASTTTGVTVNGVNTINSSGKIPALSSTYFASLSAANLTSIPAGQLTGTVSASVGGVPAGLVAFSTGGSCPTGWTEYTTARGRYIVGLVSGGSNGATVGTSLSNSEDRAVGQHNHTGSVAITDPGHTHGLNEFASGGGGLNRVGEIDNAAGAVSPVSGLVAAATTGISATTTINNSGSVAGTNAPYVQLIACQKS